MLKEITIKVPEESIKDVISMVSIMLKYKGEDPYINNYILNSLVSLDSLNKQTINNNNNNIVINNKTNKTIDNNKFNNYPNYYIPTKDEVIDYVFYKNYQLKIDANAFYDQFAKNNWRTSTGQVVRWTSILDTFVSRGYCPGVTEREVIPELPLSVAKGA